MKIEIADSQTGDRIEFSFNGVDVYSGTILEIGNQRVRTDYINRNTQHKRNQWIRFHDVILCETSDIATTTKEIITNELKEII